MQFAIPHYSIQKGIVTSFKRLLCPFSEATWDHSTLWCGCYDQPSTQRHQMYVGSPILLAILLLDSQAW